VLLLMGHAGAEGGLPLNRKIGHVPSSGSQGQGKHSRKRTEFNPHSDLGSTTKRQATADVAAPSSDFNPSTFGVCAPVATSADSPHIPARSSPYLTRSRSQQRAQIMFDTCEHNARNAPVHTLPDAWTESDRAVQPRNHSASSAIHEKHAYLAGNPFGENQLVSDHDAGIQADVPLGSPLPVSQAACFDDSLMTLTQRTACKGDDTMKVAKSGSNPLFDPQGWNASLDADPFLPDSWDADSLAEWFVYLISWQNQQHSIQGLVGGLYVLAFTQELWEKVTWAPVSVIALLALFAVGHSAMPAGMPALSKMLRKAGVTDQVRCSI
jgi:hypothetical protein